jgi:hypothetical protein
MAFQITVQNDGEEGTVSVVEAVNDNEHKEVFHDVIAKGGSQLVDCIGTAPKDFTWTHLATSTTGGPTTVDAGGTLRVWS